MEYLAIDVLVAHGAKTRGLVVAVSDVNSIVAVDTDTV